MDKRVALAVAGSGKTQYIIDKLDVDSRALIVTYTVNNATNLRKRILKKFGFVPEGMRVYTYFSFLISFCLRPIAGNEIKIKGICYDIPSKYAKRHSNSHYLTKNNRIYHSRISKLIMDCDGVSDVSNRIEKYFDLFCVDEVQDFAANDFNLLCELAKSKIEILLVGDFFQHTFDTSRDGNTRKNLHSDYKSYLACIEKVGYKLDLTTLSHSFRCSPTICKFVTDEIGIPIYSHRKDEVIVEVLEGTRIKEVFFDNTIIKLFFKESSKYVGWTDNWGNTKGLDDFEDVCVVLNQRTFKAFENKALKDLAPSTANKLYVACTRAKRNLYFVSQKELVKYRMES